MSHSLCSPQRFVSCGPPDDAAISIWTLSAPGILSTLVSPLYTPVTDYCSSIPGRLHLAFPVTMDQLWLGKTSKLCIQSAATILVLNSSLGKGVRFSSFSFLEITTSALRYHKKFSYLTVALLSQFSMLNDVKVLHINFPYLNHCVVSCS